MQVLHRDSTAPKFPKKSDHRKFLSEIFKGKADALLTPS